MGLSKDKIEFGVCYYPEHWSENMIDEDMERIKAIGIEIIRIAEFAWSIFEKEEGVYSFEYFDMVLCKALKHKLKVIFCTPTATPPAWLCKKYPEVLNKTMDGKSFGHGMRRHVNFSSEKFIELSRKIVEKIANHYANHPAIIGWQIDNEFNCEVAEYYSDVDRSEFEKYIRKKYETLENLNKAWGTVFWNQTYTDWEQIDLSVPTPNNSVNPHRALDEKRFFSWVVRRYCKMQSDVLRKYIGDRYITTNGSFANLDYHKMTKESLDFISYDSYPQFAYEMAKECEDEENGFNDRWWSLNLSKVRSVSRNFAIMEQQASSGGWVNRIHMPHPKPQQIRLWVFQSIIHGADLISFFRWRTAPFGTEIYWRGINDHDNHNNRRLSEIREIIKDAEKLTGVAGRKYQSTVALLHDYDNEWDSHMDKCYGPLLKESESNVFRYLQKKHIPLDILNLDDCTSNKLDEYKLLIYPHPAIIDSARIMKIRKYIENGGQVVFGALSGFKDINGRSYCENQVNPIRDLCGIAVDEWTMLHPNLDKPTVLLGGKRIKVSRCAEELRVIDCEPIGRYADSYMVNGVFATKRTIQKGKAYYTGSMISEEMMDYIVKTAGVESVIKDRLIVDECIEVAVRGEYIFVLNYKDRFVDIEILSKSVNVLNDDVLCGEFTMKPFEVIVLKVL